MNEDMEAELIESSEMDSKTYNLAVTGEVYVDEYIPNLSLKEQNTHTYKDTMDIDVDKTTTFEKRNKLNTVK